MNDDTLIVVLVEDFKRKTSHERSVKRGGSDPKALRGSLQARRCGLNRNPEFAAQASLLRFVPPVCGLDVR
ncbi:MAG TPA: hypothetical protein VFA35_09595 [Burkholderiaceae bacterium]|nr:hypothetical protein [Burkholderiaceae bacterium]